MKNEFVLIPKEDFLNLQSKMDTVIELLQDKTPNEADEIIDGKWLPASMAMEMLKRKTTTLWKMRKAGLLIHSKFNNTVYYDRQSIIDLLERNQQGTIEGD